MLGGSTCPSCEMPFDKGKKRRLIDSCGHERCYSCLFRSEACPLCLRGCEFNDDEDQLEKSALGDEFATSSTPLSTFELTDGWLDESSMNSLCGSPRPRSKITTRANLPLRIMHVSPHPCRVLCPLICLQLFRSSKTKAQLFRVYRNLHRKLVHIPKDSLCFLSNFRT